MCVVAEVARDEIEQAGLLSNVAVVVTLSPCLAPAALKSWRSASTLLNLLESSTTLSKEMFFAPGI